MTDVLIKRELLEQVASEFEHDNDHYMLGRELRKILAAPRQPDGDHGWLVSLELPELQCNCAWNPDSHDKACPAYLRDRMADAQRAIAELREECSFLKECQENAMLHMTGLVAERNTLRQQLAERDAEIMEQCRLNGMGAERELKLMTQRDKLAEVLGGVEREHDLIRRMKNCEIQRSRRSFGIAVMSDPPALEWQALDKELQKLIDARRAALTEVIK